VIDITNARKDISNQNGSEGMRQDFGNKCSYMTRYRSAGPQHRDVIKSLRDNRDPDSKWLYIGVLLYLRIYLKLAEV
jgi:hypothetical protein